LSLSGKNLLFTKAYGNYSIGYFEYGEWYDLGIDYCLVVWVVIDKAAAE